MKLIAKSLIGLGTIGTIGGVGAYAVGLFNSEKTKNTYRKRLIKEGFDTNVTNWTTILNAYNLVKDTEKTFKVTNEEQEKEQNLVQKCNALLEKDENNEKDYKRIKRWCVKEEKAEEILKKLRIKVLDTKTENDKVNWQNKVQSLKSIDPISTKLDVSSSKDEAANITAIKAKCQTLIETKTTAEEFEENFKLAKEWCGILDTTDYQEKN